MQELNIAKEKRLIDYEKAKAIAIDVLRGKITTVTAVKLVTLLKGATVDAVEVVRCKDCEYACDGNYGLVCTAWGARTDENMFCANGERKEEE